MQRCPPSVPYGIAPGNHDMNSSGVSQGYDHYFPVSRMSGYPWYGGYLGQNLFSFTDPINRQNKNNFELFSAGGMDFVIIHLEYDMPSYAVAWADRVLKAYPNRGRSSPRTCSSTPPGRPSQSDRAQPDPTDGTPAATVWTNLIVPNCNVFMVLNGHYPGEANRTDATPTNARLPQPHGPPARVRLPEPHKRRRRLAPVHDVQASENKIYVYTFSPR